MRYDEMMRFRGQLPKLLYALALMCSGIAIAAEALGVARVRYL